MCGGAPSSCAVVRHGGVYPRVCGGAHDARRSFIAGEGLSPRVRGSLVLYFYLYATDGSIPACAGEPARRVGCLISLWVYPRVCGGAAFTLAGITEDQGLSPRVRGSLSTRQEVRSHVGSIPACAGEPARSFARTGGGRVYPRVCGGAREAQRVPERYLGLSPRVRGSPKLSQRGVDLRGSIPACAGEPCRRIRSTADAGVYPRVCGGADFMSYHPGLPPGLSPRVRGSRVRRDRPDVAEGSIPACAGEPSILRRGWTSLRVYPRVCGGAGAATAASAFHMGLSPRVRGSRSPRRRVAFPPGSIPACAGEPYTDRSRVGA